MFDNQNRRDFIKNFARNTVLSILGLIGGFLLLRKRDENAAHTCINEFICHGCGVFNKCILPQAASAKKSMKLNSPQMTHER